MLIGWPSSRVVAPPRCATLSATGQPRLVPVCFVLVVQALRAKYPQYREHRIDALPLIRVVIDEVVAGSAQPGPLQR